MALTDTEIQTVKNLLGYGSMTPLALPYLEYAPIFEQVVQQNLNAFGETYIRSTILPNVADLDVKLQNAAIRYGIKELVGDAVLDTSPSNTQHAQLLRLRGYWLDRLSETVRIPRANKPSSAVMEVY